jgi:hypothetical protein
MSWCWFARLPEPDAADLSWAVASAPAADPDGRPAGLVVAWPRGRKPIRTATRRDERVVDLGLPGRLGVAGAGPTQLAPLFDDPAVSQAMRRVLADPPFAAVSTLVRDAVHFAGAVTVAQGDDPGRLADDPFARLYPARILRVARACSAACPRHPDRSSSATPASRGRWPGSTTAEHPIRPEQTACWAAGSPAAARWAASTGRRPRRWWPA